MEGAAGGEAQNAPTPAWKPQNGFHKLPHALFLFLSIRRGQFYCRKGVKRSCRLTVSPECHADGPWTRRLVCKDPNQTWTWSHRLLVQRRLDSRSRYEWLVRYFTHGRLILMKSAFSFTRS